MRNLPWLICLLVFLCACGGKTGTCSTTCFSKSTGQNLGTNTFSNYTEEECKELLENRQTSLTDCFYEWDAD